jgi:hypothetical protein
VLQRRLFDVSDRAWRVFSETCTEPGGRLAFDGVIGAPPDDRDGVDDFYEPFFNWPLLYVFGGGDELLDAAKRHWRAVTAQLTELGMLAGGHDRGYDWFHQGEGLLFFYNLCLADPHDAELRAQAVRSAALYLPDGPGNYDPEHNIVTAPHNGADGPRSGLTAEPAIFPWSPVFHLYGLPLGWIPGIDTYEQLLADPAAAALMGREMRDRMGRGDVAANLAVTSLMALAHMATGEDVYRDWVLRYSGGWLDRQRANGGLLPDNVGRSGEVGEYLEGRWYGGHYGWSWPHGLHTVGAAAVVAACNAVAVGGDDAYFELGRGPLDAVMQQLRPGGGGDGGGKDDGDREPAGLATVPFKHDDRGWFCPKPMQMSLPVALWHSSQAVLDGERIEQLRRASDDRAWREILPVRTKEEAGHETPWLAYLSGENPDYPERALGVALGQVADRLAAIARRTGPSEPADLHHWQQLNPVVTEILSQLTCGAPQQLYNGGLWYSRLRYYRDPEARRPGLPDEVAALVTGMDAEHVALQLVNLDPVMPHRVLIQAGAYAEHEFGVATDEHTGGRWPIDGRFVEVVLPPAHAVTLRLTQRLRVHPPLLAGTPQPERAAIR